MMVSANFILGLALFTLQSAHAQTTTDCSSVRLKSPTPASLYCGGNGTVGNPSVLGTYTFTGRSYTPCRNVCLQDKSCITFQYISTTGKCTLYSKSLHDMDYDKKKTQASTVYYNRKCFSGKCTTTCPEAVEPTVPQPPPGNLVKNPSFSPDGSDWDFSSQSTYAETCDETSFAYDGVGFAQLEDYPEGAGATITTQLNTPSNSSQNYDLTFKWAIIKYGADTNLCEMASPTSNGMQVSTFDGSATMNTYMHLTFGPYTGPSSVEVDLLCGGSGTDQTIVNVDQVYVVPSQDS